MKLTISVLLIALSLLACTEKKSDSQDSSSDDAAKKIYGQLKSDRLKK